jgi:glc operon protein GlcG
MRIIFAALIVAAFLQTNAGAQTNAPYGEPISSELARKAAAATIAAARKSDWQIAVAIVDPAGELVFFERIDGTQTGSIALAIEKAKTSVAYKRSTKNLEDRIVEGRMQYLKQVGAMPIEGGLPIILGGKVVGGLGVSGVRSHQDGVAAQAGIDAIASPQ